MSFKTKDGWVVVDDDGEILSLSATPWTDATELMAYRDIPVSIVPRDSIVFESAESFLKFLQWAMSGCDYDEEDLVNLFAEFRASTATEKK